MPIPVSIVCPYCGKNNVLKNVVFNNKQYRNTMVCDLDDGGCDKTFFYEITVRYKAEAFEIHGYNKGE